MIEISLLKALSTRENYYSYRHLLNPKLLATQSIQILKDYDIWFKRLEQYPTAINSDTIDFDFFSEMFFLEEHPDWDEKKLLEYRQIIIKIQDCPIEPVESLIKRFKQQVFYEELHKKLDHNIDIKEIEDSINTLKTELKTLDFQNKAEQSLDEALISIDRSKGLQWRLDCLKEHFNGGLINGDFIIVAGYTDSGKSSFLASELSYMAQQLTGDQYILWLNNEGDWKRLLPRLYCATLNCTEEDLRRYTDKAKSKYQELMKGNKDRIKIMDIQGLHVKDIETLVKKAPPALIVFDMLDHLRGFENYAGGEEGSHVRYGKLYQWARELSSNICPILATSQLNREGANTEYTDIVNLKGSGIDKQGAAIVVLFIGALEGDEHTRYLSTPKFKLSGKKGWKKAVKFDPDRSRFI